MVMPRGGKRVRWALGSIFAVPLEDGTYGCGQAIALMMPNIVYCALTSHRFQELPTRCPAVQRGDVISLLAVWRNSLGSGKWPIVCELSPIVEAADFPNEQFAASGYVGARHYDEGIAAAFLSAYFGLIPWNGDWIREWYLDDLLAPGIERPATAVLLSPKERHAYRVARGLPV
jgi:hypothetical protein